MLYYYLLFIVSLILANLNSAYLYKKYQLTAGTALGASILYMIINGIISAVMPLLVIWFTGRTFETTLY